MDPRYRLALAQRIAQKYRDPDSRVVVDLMNLIVICIVNYLLYSVLWNKWL